MRDASVEIPPLIDWGVATLALAGQTESGDLHLVKPVGRGVLVAAVDGLGHGAEAAAAARAAVTALDRHADEFLIPVVRKCHEALIGTRGVVMSLAYLDGAKRSLIWLGIGNVEGVNHYGRTGEHRPEGMFIATGPGVPPGLLDRVVSILDFAPTFAGLFGVELPQHDGTPVAELLRSELP